MANQELNLDAHETGFVVVRSDNERIVVKLDDVVPVEEREPLF